MVFDLWDAPYTLYADRDTFTGNPLFNVITPPAQPGTPGTGHTGERV